MRRERPKLISLDVKEKTRLPFILQIDVNVFYVVVEAANQI